MNDRSTPDAISLAGQAVEAALGYVRHAQHQCHAVVTVDGRIDPARVEAAQRQVHGFAWAATTVEGLVQLTAWARRLALSGRSGAGEDLVLRAGMGEYLAQLLGGLPMSQNEMVRPSTSERRTRPSSCARTPPCAGSCGTATPPHTGRAGAPAGRRLAPERDAGRRNAGHGPRPVPPVHRRADRAPRPCLAPGRRADPGRRRRRHGGIGRVRRVHRRGARRPRSGQARHVRGVGGAEPRLDRRRVARHPVGDRGRADRRQRHAGAEGALAARHRRWGRAAHGRVHRAGHRLGPRICQDAGRADGGWRLAGHRVQDLDHPRLPQRPDDGAGADGCGASRATAGLSMLLAAKTRGTPGDAISPIPACPAARSACWATAA